MSARHLARVIHSVLREALHRHARSPQWRSVEKAHLRAQPLCAACGGTRLLQVHHVIAFEVAPSLELDPGNLTTLCMGPGECHLRIGHGDCFRFYNPLVREHSIRARTGDTAAAEILALKARLPIHRAVPA